MRFSEFVGEPDLLRKKLKKIVDTPLGPTDEKFYNDVARRDNRYVTETSIGYSLSKIHLKRSFDYIKSWLIRYNIKYEATNPYLTFTTTKGEYNRDRFIKALKKIRESHVFKPEGVYILREGDIDYIIIEYEENNDFGKSLDECVSNFSLAKGDNTCYVKLFSMKTESFPLELFDQMVFSMPDLPSVRPGSVGLLVRRK